MPSPTASVAYASLCDCETFSGPWASRAEALGTDPLGSLTVLGDGSEWIWRAAATRFPAASQVLDIFHAVQHIASAASALYGEATPESAAWTEQGRRALMADGWPGLLDHIGATVSEARSAAGQVGLDELIGYFAKHTSRVGYYGRLRSGQSIGSGGVESLARRLGHRLKVAGRGWCVEHVDGMAALIVMLETPEWTNHGRRRAA